MVKNHLLRIAMPKTWQISRKEYVFAARPNSGAHSLEMGLPLCIILRDLLNLGRNLREIKYMLNNKEILVDGKRQKEPNFIVGLMDVIHIAEIKKSYRVMLNENGKLCVVDAHDHNLKICRITGKKTIKGNKQTLHFHDGKTFVVDGDYNVSDSVVMEVGKGIKKRLPLKEGATILLIGGKHIGEIGEIAKIVLYKAKDDGVVVKTKDDEFMTLKKYAFVIGELKLRD